MHGSAGLIQTLLEEDLVDELRLIVFPVTLGEGKRLFGEGAIPRTWKLGVVEGDLDRGDHRELRARRRGGDRHAGPE